MSRQFQAKPQSHFQDNITQRLSQQITKVNELVFPPDVEFEILVDTREPAVIKDRMCECKYVKLAKLEEGGDFQFLLKGKLLYAIERKQFNDMSSSLRSGNTDSYDRFQSQLFKLIQLPTFRCNILYLIEMSGSTDHSKDVARIEGAYTDIIVGCGMRFMPPSTGVEHTIFQLLKLASKIHQELPKCLRQIEGLKLIPKVSDSKKLDVEEEYEDDGEANLDNVIRSTSIGDVSQTELGVVDQEMQRLYIESHPVAKGFVFDRKTCFIQQLTCVPKISPAKATVIAQRWGDMNQFLEYLKATDFKIVAKELSTMKAEEADDEGGCGAKKPRALGISTVQTLFKFLFGKDVNVKEALRKRKRVSKAVPDEDEDLNAIIKAVAASD